MVARHFKYTYNAHIPPKTLFSKMLLVNDVLKERIDLNTEKNRIYFSRRKQLKNLMKSINTYIDFNSQTYFLMLYYMDIIFTHKDLEKIFYSHFTLWYQYPISNDLQMSNYVLLSLACLVIASKFNENDPTVPSMSSYTRLLYEFSKKKYFFNLDYLFLAEIVVLKILKYKLNYYTIYHYLIFFFTHGIVLKKTIQRSKIFKRISERKILEKIYIKVREIFDEIIESEKYYNYYCGRDNYEIVVEILLWCTEYILGEEIKDEENIFKLIFGITIESNKKKEIYNLIEQIYSKIKGRNALSKSTQLIDMNNDKIINNNLLVPKKINLNMVDKKNKNNELIYKVNNSSNYNIHQKSCITNFNNPSINQKWYTQYSIPIQNNTNTYFFNNVNSGIQNKEFNNDKYIYNYNYSANAAYHPVENKKLLNRTTNIKYEPNKRIYITSSISNDTNSKFNVNSIEKLELKNYSDVKLLYNNNPNDNKRINTNRELKIIPFQLEKEPNDNKKAFNDSSRTILLINNDYYNNQKSRKKSLSCSKEVNENNNEYYNQKKSNYIFDKDKQLKFNEKITTIKIEPPLSSKTLNFAYTSYEQNKEKEKKEFIEKPLIKKEIIIQTNKSQISEYKKYLLSKNKIPKQKLNLLNKVPQNKITNDNLVTRTRYFESNNFKKFNSTLELEPQDNYKRRSVNKYYIDSGNKNIKKNKSYNNPNTIIINNNIQINTVIDDKSRNVYLINNNGVGDEIKNKYKNIDKKLKSN